MGPETRPPVSKAALWTGRVISTLPVLMLTMSGVMKLMGPPEVVDGFRNYGFDASILVPLGVVELACTLLYVIPRTAVLGAILVTGYLGGAIATHVRAGEPPAQYVVPVVLGVLVWLGLYLRDARLRDLVPVRN
jgi:hypothetical protein